MAWWCVFQHETVEGYRRYFNQIVGWVTSWLLLDIRWWVYFSHELALCRFFVVEDHILHATRGLVTRAFTDELWNMALSKIIAVLRTHSVSVSGEARVCLFVIESWKISGRERRPDLFVRSAGLRLWAPAAGHLHNPSVIYNWLSLQTHSQSWHFRIFTLNLLLLLQSVLIRADWPLH